jgi:hypothetical protein
LDVSGFWRHGVWAKGILGTISVLASLGREGCGFLMAVGSSATKRLHGVVDVHVLKAFKGRWEEEG